ncbi:MAG: hypothetical protein JO021_12725, partial [Alphaproteobacteria bacterium]|nr:hypothetical protein [Alphaproteobacteria bacterium]
VGFRLIDDMIVPRNHATVQTLAWERALRGYGARVVDIEFLFMLGDVVLADGTLRSIAAKLAAGHRGVMVGGLHVVHEETAAEMRARAPAGAPLVLEPRALVRFALAQPHPAWVASFVNQAAPGAAISHSAHPNHLFWRLDDTAVVGRYFMMWTAGVRPETPEFEISASNDTAFPSEFCPSGNIAVLDDSDLGFFVELTERDHEAVLLRPGPYDEAEIARGLGRWTTAQQRTFSATRVVFHAEARPADDHPVLRESDAVIARLVAALPQPAQSHRNHPYWTMQYNAFVLERSRVMPSGDARFAASTTQAGGRRLLWWLLGQPPEVRIVHPFWPDYRAVVAACRREWLGTAKRVLVLSDQIRPLATWLPAQHPPTRSRSVAGFLEQADGATYDGALVLLAPGQLRQLAPLVGRLGACLAPGSAIVLHVGDDAAGNVAVERRLVAHAGALFRPGWTLEGCWFAGGAAQARLRAAYAVAARLFVRGGAGRGLLAAGLIALVALGAGLLNWLDRRAGAPQGPCSAATVVLRKPAAAG